MNPLSPFTYYRRHQRHTTLLLSLISLVTAGLYLMIALSWAIFIEPIRLNRMFLTKFSVVLPEGRNELDPAVVAQVTAHPDVAEVIPTTMYYGLSLPHVMGGESAWLSMLALKGENLAYVMQRCGATLTEGRLLEPRTNGIMLSKEVAANLGLEVGDIIDNSIDPQAYMNILEPMQVVGILKSDVRLAIVSYEYLDGHELYRDMLPMMLVVARDGRQQAVEDFLRSEVQTTRTYVWTLQGLNESMAREYRRTYWLIIPIATIVALATTLVVGAVNRIAFARRIPELGILRATGHSRKWLTRRLTLETGVLAVAGWMMGVALAWLILYALKLALFAPRGHDLNAIGLAPAALVLLIPASVLGFTRLGVGRILSGLDPITVVERGELSPAEKQRPGRRQAKSSSKPLASSTFYRRHVRRAVLLTATMSLMIVAIVMLIFVFAAANDARQAELRNLSHLSEVLARPGSHFDPGVASQVRTHPAVERAIPYFTSWDARFHVSIPPFGSMDIYPYGVYAEDMAYLVKLYGLELKEGHLPGPRTNGLVIAEAVAQNLDLQIGDVIGDPDRPAYPGAPSLPAEFVISGIFARSSAPEEENWLSFASLEFLESHEAFNISDDFVFPLLVVPKAGQKAELDNWLENELASDDVRTLTYRQQVAQARQQTRSSIQAMILIESVIAVVAAIALAVLNYISVSQRQPEFGVLHALGYGRLQLVWRSVGEMAFTTGAAWGLSAVLCLIGLLYLQLGVFTPLGLRLNLFNLTPWLFTLPIPVAVLAVTTGTIARTLAKLDPVSIIERR
jgi:ABC-type antimicrobial peptide transport system permease subunit